MINKGRSGLIFSNKPILNPRRVLILGLCRIGVPTSQLMHTLIKNLRPVQRSDYIENHTQGEIASDPTSAPSTTPPPNIQLKPLEKALVTLQQHFYFLISCIVLALAKVELQHLL
ncbi:hypothetical protein EJ110_NYTH42961 [Nymphaea thermarum]|nr:hypothetical protein EJ110_NYTH42961 [Nymphaea thermarum]